MPILRERKELELIVWPENRQCDRSWLLENIPGAAGVIVLLSEQVNDELLDKAGPSLKVVSTMSVGYEHLFLPALAKRGIRVGYTPDILTDAGFGRIAQATLARLVPFGIRQCIYTGNPAASAFSGSSARDHALAASLSLPAGAISRVPLTDLAVRSDVLFVLAPGGPETYHTVDADFLRRMKSSAVLVNPSRGSLVDSDALARALREGWIWGAGLDVVEGEPRVGTDHPLVNEPRCVILPHIGSATFETRLGMATLAAKNVIGGVLGETMPTELDLNGQA
ncbi:hypothetical protein EW145_g7524 [Phellinidium pouzarii]|uniref:D-isomer specific 2-hydroxyacid dehydrogenase NAD-binding domain-containing protein n=1 Tax=Phellinidium pouzarii TaxID=167371 RepID=A0A4S4KJ19_9AGAM|nr:hypothetical protein EW145_g7524 [Phellinidium pouzarii]